MVLFRLRSWNKALVASRCFSTSRSLLHTNSDGIVKPWYVQEARKIETEQSISDQALLPDLPDSSPSSLRGLVQFAVKDMGLQDVTVLDKRSDDAESASSALGPALIILGTGRSTRHLGSAGSLLVTWLKREFGVYAGQDGVLTSNFVKLHNKRQKRKQQRQRMANNNSESAIQRVGSWIAIDTKIDNIYIHLMTAQRRAEVDLENLDESLEVEDESRFSTSTSYLDPVVNNPASKYNTFYSAVSSFGNKRNFSTAYPRYTLPNTREELALKNLVEERRNDLNENSREIVDFVEQFPEFPSQEDWKKRLRFFAIAAIYSPQFSLKRLIKEAELQQSHGYVLDDEDIETVGSAICYHGQSHFATLSQDDESSALWQELCDYKAQIWLDFYTTAFQPVGRSMLGNSRLLVLLYRTFTAMSANSTTPSGALEMPQSADAELSAFFDFKKLHPIRNMLQQTEEIRNIQTVGMLLASLANGRLYDAFWKVVDSSTLSGSNRDFSEQVAELALSLIVKTGNVDQITFAIQTYLPNSILTRSIRLTRTLIQAIEHGLLIVDKNETGAFNSVRQILAQSREVSPQLS